MSLGLRAILSGAFLEVRLSLPFHRSLYRQQQSSRKVEDKTMMACTAVANGDVSPGSDEAGCSRKRITHVLLDLDGTLVDTERIVDEVSKLVLFRYGKQWDARELDKCLGVQPLEAASFFVKEYDLPCTPEEYLAATLPLFEERWSYLQPLPGASRLIKHFHAHGVPLALVSNSPKKNILSKLRYQSGWAEAFSVIVGGDEVNEGKPSPDIYIEAARRLKAEPESCLVVEDSPPGVQAGKAAGMLVIAVPSLPRKMAEPLYSSAGLILSSLLDLKPEIWGLPQFEDWICNALPIEPWYIGGPVVKGFGRGSKVLGIPTANLSTTAFSKILANYVCGIYLGWAGLSTRGIFKMVMSVGWNPYFDNSEKTVEPWLLHEFPEDFYGEELRLIVVGYIRPEANFPSLEALVERIHEDGRIARAALDVRPYSTYKDDPYLTSNFPEFTEY